MANLREIDRDPWALYQPSSEAPWNRRRVVHLHRRAAFAATVDELERDLEDGPGPSIDRLLSGRVSCEAAIPGFEKTIETITDAAVDSHQPERLQAAWVLRMLASPDPLRERLALMWHNHFATGNQKVQHLAAMRRQNDTFRKYALSPFGELLCAAVRDPALLIWLDAPANRKGHPNENLARELMELFTVGIGHYSEDDVKEAARALTGWTVRDGAFLENSAGHDSGPKIILGESKEWDGCALVLRLLEHPATAHRLATRICELLMGESSVDAHAIDGLARGLFEHGLDIGWGVATVLRSRSFFAQANMSTRVLGPVEFVGGAVRALGCKSPVPGTIVLAEWIKRLGQELFYPPNVGGWSGGRQWLSSRGLIARANFAMSLFSGGEPGQKLAPDVLELARRIGPVDRLDQVVESISQIVLGYLPSEAWRERIVEESSRNSPSLAARSQTAAALILSSTEAQLG
jgi:uncharacterized protein (DUF1800 family)